MSWPNIGMSQSDTDRNPHGNLHGNPHGKVSNPELNGDLSADPDMMMRLDQGSLLGPMTDFNAELCDLYEKYFI